MHWLTYIFPCAVAALIVLFFLGCPGAVTSPKPIPGKQSFERAELILLAVIVAVYSLTAFYKLGDTEAPQSFMDTGLVPGFADADLGDEYEITGIMRYAGLNTGKYHIMYSADGTGWNELAAIDQKYSELFKWIRDDIEPVRARYIRVVFSTRLYIGELALFTRGGMLDAQSFVLSEDIAPLFDEQELVPERPDYLNSTYFDEIYHARTALEHIQNIYPYEVSHPPLGKLILSLGIRLFGMTPFGWRFSGTLLGALMLLPLYMLLKRMFGGAAVPLCGTAIFAFDFMHFTQTRIATIDTYGVFFIILMYLFMYLYVSGGRLRDLALSGVFFGLGAASKWTAIYAGAGLAVIWLLYWIRQLRSGGKFMKFLFNCLFCLVFFVAVPGVIYYLSYIPYGTASGMSGAEMLLSKEYADIVLNNQKFMLSYHEGVMSEHPYSSRWYQWLLDIRPILYYLDRFDDGTRSSFGAFVDPVLCWAGLISLPVTAYCGVKWRDTRAGFILLGYLAQLLPWVFIGRTTFEYHYFPSTVFLTLSLCYVFSVLEDRDPDWKIRVYGLTGMSLALFVVFYPVLSGARGDQALLSALLKWLPTWPF